MKCPVCVFDAEDWRVVKHAWLAHGLTIVPDGSEGGVSPVSQSSPIHPFSIAGKHNEALNLPAESGTPTLPPTSFNKPTVSRDGRNGRGEREKTCTEVFAWEYNKNLSPEDKHEARQYLAKSYGYVCKICNNPFPEAMLHEAIELDHIKRPEQVCHYHHIWNMQLATKKCNQRAEAQRRAAARRAWSQQQPIVSTLTERENVFTTVTGFVSSLGFDPSSEETGKHGIMRYRWNCWLYTAEGWKDRESRYVARPPLLPGGNILKTALAEDAPNKLRIGTSITYLRYIREDWRAHLLEVYPDDGKLYVRLGEKALQLEGFLYDGRISAKTELKDLEA